MSGRCCWWRSWGSGPTGGYAIEILAVADRGPELVATVERRSPGRRCGTTQAVTQPAHIVAVPSSAKPVRREFRDVASDCG